MKKKIFLALSLMLISLFMVKPALAAYTFKITSIGEMNVIGSEVKIWRTTLKPIIRGTANPSSDINVTIDSSTLQVSADSEGTWVYTPMSDLTAGDHSLRVANVNVGTTIGALTPTPTPAQISMTVVAGSTKNANSQAQFDSTALPRTGMAWPTILLLIFGIGTICLTLKNVLI